MPDQKLIALDEDDLVVISAHVQDALVVSGDIMWRPHEKRLVVGMRRPDCEQKLTGECEPRTLISALRFERVLSCKSREIDVSTEGIALTLLGIEFNDTQAPGGDVLLLFSNGGMLRLDVECIECELVDLGADHESHRATGDQAFNAPV